jgi:hypothetical protein
VRLDTSDHVLAFDRLAGCHRVIRGWQTCVVDALGNVIEDAVEVNVEEGWVDVHPFGGPTTRLRKKGLRVEVRLQAARAKRRIEAKNEEDTPVW